MSFRSFLPEFVIEVRLWRVSSSSSALCELKTGVASSVLPELDDGLPPDSRCAPFESGTLTLMFARLKRAGAAMRIGWQHRFVQSHPKICDVRSSKINRDAPRSGASRSQYCNVSRHVCRASLRSTSEICPEVRPARCAATRSNPAAKLWRTINQVPWCLCVTLQCRINPRQAEICFCTSPSRSTRADTWSGPWMATYRNGRKMRSRTSTKRAWR